MGLGLKRTFSTGDKPVFQVVHEVVQGGFLIDTSVIAIGSIIKQGTPMIYDESTRKAKPMTTGVVVENAGGTATTYKIAKGHNFKVGDYFAATVGGKAYAITAIDTTSSTDYDSVTVGTTIGAVNANAFVFASSATGATSAAFPSGSKGLNYRDQKVDIGESVTIVLRGTVYARRVPYSTDLEAALPKIVYSQSY